MRTRSDEIKDRIEEMRRTGAATHTEELMMLQIEMLAELNNTLVFIKENTRMLSYLERI